MNTVNFTRYGHIDAHKQGYGSGLQPIDGGIEEELKSPQANSDTQHSRTNFDEMYTSSRCLQTQPGVDLGRDFIQTQFGYTPHAEYNFNPYQNELGTSHAA